ncbi:MAG: PadR family transcriptional regulator [Candidatus Methylarchaceae archaeon HK01B]|nr:PadR family transcriptional regulator [Candidatus Methylarchaceae archaeon HK01M]MCP8318625.1 PadR family transcriptional regulator [Candidatus Methylarchaceae archaeon HK01B]
MSSSNFLSAPRGLLKIFILKTASKMPLSGTDISNQISLSTHGDWRPSPGSVYFILKELLSLKMISEVISPGSNVKRYITTDKGKKMLSSFFKVSDRVLKRQFVFIGVAAQIAENDIAKILVELAKLIVDSDKGKEAKIKLALNQLISTLKEL